jgi:GTP-binding protein EngB required for normal cell division
MSNLLEPTLAPGLTQLERFWFWKRRHLVQELYGYIRAADAHMLQLEHQEKFLQNKLEKINEEHAQLQSIYAEKIEQLDECNTKHHKLSALHEELRAEADKLRQDSKRLTAQNADLERQWSDTSFELSKSQYEHAQLHSDHISLMQELVNRNNELQSLSEKYDNQLALSISREKSFQDLQCTYQNLMLENSSLQIEHRELNIAYELAQNRYDLVCAILNCQPADNPSLQQLQHWLAGDFVQNVQRLELPAKATTHALEQARAIAQHVELLADTPALHDKFLVAVAGGFSSGKSSFISSFMVSETSELLPTGINPVTAIPTYVMPGKSLVIEGHTLKGAHMPLTPEAYGSLTHDFILEMGFNVKEIMPYVVLQSPMPRLEHIAFIDMPGYNPAYSETADTAADEGIASVALTEADAVIWLLGLDSNGTLSSDDISFLLEHADGSKPLYVVVNKADLRPRNAVMEIVEEIKRNLDRSGIGYEGISAYSATLGRELFHYGKSLNEVMSLWDHRSSAAAAVHKEFESLMNGLEEASELMKKSTENVKEILHSLHLDFSEILAHTGASAETWTTGRILGRSADRTEQLRKDAIDKFVRLQIAVTTTVGDDLSVILKNLREHGHELLRNVCVSGTTQTGGRLLQ